MNVAEVCNHRVISVSLGASLIDAVALMYGERVGTVIVTHTVAGREVVAGILTDRDILRRQLDAQGDFSQLGIADAMTPEPLVVLAADDVTAVLQRLRTRGVRRAPVVDELGVPVGLVSTDDLLRHLAGEIGGLAAIVAMQVGAAG
jgi:CBS domain-containing protein